MKKEKMMSTSPNSIDNIDIVELKTLLYRFKPRIWQLCV